MAGDIETLARKYAFQNAVEYDGKANPGSVIGRVMAADHDLRTKSKEVAEVVNAVVSEVNALPMETQRAALEKLAPELLVKKKREIVHELPELESAEKGVLMRLAPNPSGPLHIGHTRMAILNDEYVKRYGGKLIVRMEDTNPPTILPDAYDLILKDLDWLGVEYHEVVNQSSRFPIYYEHAVRLLDAGHAYMCGCNPDDWRGAKEQGKGCPHRDAEPATHLDLWEKMLSGDFKPGEMSMIVKTDLEHPNPAVRDFVALRLVDEPHPLTGDDYRVYPLYNYSVAIDDHLMGMTHVLRGKDHLNNTLRQEYVYDHLGWPRPFFHHYGWVSIEDTELSTRNIRAAIVEGKFTGWDDTRLGTVAALARRGIQPAAIRQYWIEVGTKGVDIKFSWENLYAYNKDIVDPVAHRYFFVWDEKKIQVSGVDKLEGKAQLLPDNPDAGFFNISITKEKEEDDYLPVYVTSSDLSQINPGDVVRLKDIGNIESISLTNFKYVGNDLNVVKQGARIIHTIGDNHVEVNVHMPNGEIIKGLMDETALNDIGKVVQFVRFGFVKLESEEEIEAYFAHT
jgi:glutamyl-tRNA synthetase